MPHALPIGSACGIYREKRNAYKILVGKPKRKRPLLRPDRAGRIMLTHILQKDHGRAQTELIWPRIGKSGRLL